MIRLVFSLALTLSGTAASAQPARPFGTEPAWPAGGISDVLTSRETAPATTSPPSNRVQPSTRVRAPYAQAEQPAPIDLEAVRRDQRARLRDPAGWRRGTLRSQQERQADPTSRFRETPLAPQLPD